MSSHFRRSAGEIRIAFKILTANMLARPDKMDAFESLWDEANKATMEVITTLVAQDYLALLREMNRWHQEEKIRAARHRHEHGARFQ